jgi:hypothetical protein
MANSKVPSFGRSDKQIANTFGMSVSDFKKVKKQIVSDMTKPKATATPKAKQKTLNDFLKEGKRPPIKNKKIPSDADVIIKGYNDKKTLSKNKKRK